LVLGGVEAGREDRPTKEAGAGLEKPRDAPDADQTVVDKLVELAGRSEPETDSGVAGGEAGLGRERLAPLAA